MPRVRPAQLRAHLADEVAPAKARRACPEEQIHRAIYAYLKATLPHGWIPQHTPNKPRSMQQGAREKAMGAIAGWPDLAIYGPGEHGPSTWFIEVKAPRGRVMPHQHAVHDHLMDAGFKVGIARSVEDARALCRAWGLPIREAVR